MSFENFWTTRRGVPKGGWGDNFQNDFKHSKMCFQMILSNLEKNYSSKIFPFFLVPPNMFFFQLPSPWSFDPQFFWLRGSAKSRLESRL